VTALTKLYEQMVDNSGRDIYYRSVTEKEVKKIEARMKEITDDADSRTNLMTFVKQALHVFAAEAHSMSAIAREVRCPDDDKPCPISATHIPLERFEKEVVPELEKATKIQDGMQQLPSTPTLLLIPSYEWYGLALLHCAGAAKPLEGKSAWWKCSDVNDDQRKRLSERAEQQFLKSLDRRAGRLVSIFNLGLAYEAQGKVGMAKHIFSKFLEQSAGSRGDVRTFHAKSYVNKDTSALFARTNIAQEIPDHNIAPIVGAALLAVALIAGVMVVVAYRRRVAFTGAESLAQEDEEGLAESLAQDE